MSKNAITELEEKVRRIEAENPIPVFGENNKTTNKKIDFEALKKLANSIRDEVIDYV